jgi:hypothetical protein
MDEVAIVDAYGAAWNEADEARRLTLLDASWAQGGVYQDPTGRAEGRSALHAHIGGFHLMMPGHTIENTSGVDVYGANFRFTWRMLNGAEPVAEGMDFGTFDGEGRIASITGFFGPFPQRAS